MSVKIKNFKCSEQILYCIILFLLVLNNQGFVFKESSSKSALKNTSASERIKAKIHFSDMPNQSDFFTNSDLGKYSEIGNSEKLKGIWSGQYNLMSEAIYWFNPAINKNKIISLIDFKDYTLDLKILPQDSRGLTLQLSQESVSYSSVNIAFENKRQLNYWAKLSADNWFEVVRGKIFRINEDELFTVFQTTVYEERTPIYAFNGEMVLSKKLKE